MSPSQHQEQEAVNPKASVAEQRSEAPGPDWKPPAWREVLHTLRPREEAVLDMPLRAVAEQVAVAVAVAVEAITQVAIPQREPRYQEESLEVAPHIQMVNPTC